LIAGASRIVGTLDDKPAALLVPATTPTVGGNGSVWRALRVTPARASIAAVLVVAVGIALTRNHVATEPPVLPATAAISSTAQPPNSNASVAAPDTVLRSAIARRVATDQPQRVIGRAPDAAAPTVPTTNPAAGTAQMSPSAATEVAVGRAVALSDVVTTGARADKLMAKASSAPAPGDKCYRIEAADGRPATWEGAPLPVEIALSPNVALVDAGGTTRRTITPMGGGDGIGNWSMSQGDTLSIVLKGMSATTTGVLAPSGSTLSGALNAAPANGAASGAAPQSYSRQATGGRMMLVVARTIACQH
jgi:hypothetical protein